MSTGITTNPQQTTQNLPAHLQREAGDKPMGLQLLNQYIIPPRLKIVQPQSKPELKSQFAEGSVICMPAKMPVVERVYDEATKRFAENSNPFTFTPLFFFPEYFCFNPIQLGNLPAIRDRSTDNRSEVARKAKRKEWREEPCPEDAKFNIRYCEALTFIVHITDVEALWGIPVTMSFMRGEYGTGQRFITDIGLRKADLFGNVFQAVTGHRIKDQFNWYGYNISSPAPGTQSQWVEDAGLFAFYKEEHIKFAEAYAANLLRSDVDDDDVRPQGDTVVDATAATSGQF